MLALQATIGNAAVARLVSPARIAHRPRSSSGVLARFVESEHKELGDVGSHGARVELAPGYTVSYGDVVAMSGDWFTNIDEMRKLAESEDGRLQLEYVRLVEVGDLTTWPPTGATGYVYPPTADSGDMTATVRKALFVKRANAAKEAAKKRFNQLAARNIAHFPYPRRGDTGRSVDELAGRKERVPYIFPLPPVPVGAIATYHDAHANAVLEAMAAGRRGSGLGSALAAEAASNHYLTDSFSAGHLMTPREDATAYWNGKVPDFSQKLKGWLVDQIVPTLRREHWIAEGLLTGIVRQRARSKIDEKLDAAGVPLTFGDIVSGTIHDYYNFYGVDATVGGRRLHLYGDHKLHEGDAGVRGSSPTFRSAAHAVEVSMAEVQQAYDLARAGKTDAEIADAILTRPGGARRFAAIDLIPVPDPAAERSGPKWEVATTNELLAGGPFVAGLQRFAEHNAKELKAVVASEEAAVQTAIGEVADRFEHHPVEVLQAILAWTHPVLDPQEVIDYEAIRSRRVRHYH